MSAIFRVIQIMTMLAPCSSFADGRFLQVRHPTGGDVVMQLSFPNAEGCATLLRKMSVRTEATAKETASLS